MKGALVVFAGASKSGKTTLAKRLAAERHLPIVTFSDTVRRRASEKYPGSTQNLRLLQDVGAELVSDNPAGFCREVFAQHKLKRYGCSVVDGLRHNSLLPVLRALNPELKLVVIYAEASQSTRCSRFTPVLTQAQLEEVDIHPVEGQLQELRASADMIISTERSEDDAFGEMCAWLDRRRLCTPKKPPQTVHIEAGLLRLWIVLSVAWVLFASFSLLSLSKNDSAAAQQRFTSSSWLIPLDCKTVRGVVGTDFVQYHGQCWMDLASLARLYPELGPNSVSEPKVSKDSGTSRPATAKNWTTAFGRWLRVVLIVPAILLIFGYNGCWVVQGFKRGRVWSWR